MDIESWENSLVLLKGIVGDGEVRQTHASVVLMQDEFVYKIKKPVDFGFLDYRSLQQRRTYSILEKELNERYSDDVYVDVLKLVPVAGGAYALVPIANTVPAVEYVLKMRRVAEDKFLSTRIDSTTGEELKRIGGEVARRLSVASVAPDVIEGLPIYESITFNCKENFSQIADTEPKLGEKLVDERLRYIEKATNDFLTANKDLFNRRYTGGFVKDGHGDLRLEHIYIGNDGKISLIDCIEFNTRFRTNDVTAEAAFLSMELDYAGKIGLSDAFLGGFFDFYNDKDSISLLNFYRAYRAVVRAKVAAFTMLGCGRDNPLYADKYAEYNRLMDMAVTYALTMNSVCPLVLFGIIGAGKSELAKALAERFPVQCINTDEVRKGLAGKPADYNGVVAANEGLYTQERTIATYNKLGEIVADALKVARLPLCDGTFLKTANVKAFEEQLTSVTPIYIEVRADENIIKERLKVRESSGGVSDGRLQHYETLKNSRDYNTSDLTIDGALPAATSVATLLKFLLK
ncbi:bifunctional aminoglycoside phosphotransferase/ATP-binding protein [Deferribacterales bacterium RsTz2092]|nr:aminoglycoside phosphotransferase [Deferribacterales bacterium]